MVVAAAHKSLLVLASDSLKVISKTFSYTEEAYALFYGADSNQNLQLTPCVDDALSNVPSAIGVPVGQPSDVLQSCGDGVSARKTKPFICARSCPS